MEYQSASKTLLKEFGLELLQPVNGYRFSVDSVLLGRFVRLRKGQSRVFEVGAGCGVVGLILARRFSSASLELMEIQEQLYNLCRENIRLNRLSERVRCIHGDVRKVRTIYPAENFTDIVSNPPFRNPVSGRLCLDSQEALARHEILVTLKEILDASSYLLAFGGRFSIIYPAERCAELMDEMCEAGLEPKRMQAVHPAPDKAARMILVEGIKGGGRETRIEPPIFLK